MFFRGSRYENIAEGEHVDADGRTIRYKRARFIPAGGIARPAYIVRQGDRPDLAAYAVIGDPEMFWRLCDLNLVLRPVDLTAFPGARIAIPDPQGGC